MEAHDETWFTQDLVISVAIPGQGRSRIGRVGKGMRVVARRCPQDCLALVSRSYGMGVGVGC